MGGRSREYTHSDKWSWVGELSDGRLDNYGRMTAHKIDQGQNDIGKNALNYELSRQYQKRTGNSPGWKR